MAGVKTGASCASGAKAPVLLTNNGTAEAVPFPKPFPSQNHLGGRFYLPIPIYEGFMRADLADAGADFSTRACAAQYKCTQAIDKFRSQAIVPNKKAHVDWAVE